MPSPRWPKIKPEKASLVPVGPGKIGSSSGQDAGGPPWICCVQGKQEGGGPALPYSTAFVPCLLLAWGQPPGWQCQDNSPLSSVPLHNLAPSGEGRAGRDPTAPLSSWGGDQHCGICGGGVGFAVGAFLAFKAEILCPDGVCPGQSPGQWGARAPVLGEESNFPVCR